MELDLTSLGRGVTDEVNAYQVPAHDPAALGSPLPPEWFAAGLAEMRTSLVSPYWTRIRDMDPKSRELVILDVVVVADDRAGICLTHVTAGLGLATTIHVPTIAPVTPDIADAKASFLSFIRSPSLPHAPGLSAGLNYRFGSLADLATSGN